MPASLLWQRFEFGGFLAAHMQSYMPSSSVYMPLLGCSMTNLVAYKGVL